MFYDAANWKMVNLSSDDIFRTLLDALPFHSRVVKVEIMIFLLTLKAVYPICLESLVLFSIMYALKLFLKLVSTYLINFYILLDAFLL